MTEYRSYTTDHGIRVEIVRPEPEVNYDSRANRSSLFANILFYLSSTGLLFWAAIAIL